MTSREVIHGTTGRESRPRSWSPESRAVLNPGGGSHRRSPQRTLDDGFDSRAAGWGLGSSLPPTSSVERER